MVFLEFEKPLESLYIQLEKIKQVGEEGDIDVSDKIKELENKIKSQRKEIYDNLTGWQKSNYHDILSDPTLCFILNKCVKNSCRTTR